MEPEAFVKVDGSPLDRPDDAPWPFLPSYLWALTLVKRPTPI
jgi:hypothetical protein